jgi:hypothetical protein
VTSGAVGNAQGPGRDVDLGPLGRQGISGQHHLVFPAVEPTDAPIGSLVGAQARAVALTPGGPFLPGRLEFPVAAEDLALMADKEQCAVDGAPCEGVTLGDADGDVDARIAGRLAKSVGGGAWNLDASGSSFPLSNLEQETCPIC